MLETQSYVGNLFPDYVYISCSTPSSFNTISSFASIIFMYIKCSDRSMDVQLPTDDRPTTVSSNKTNNASREYLFENGAVVSGSLNYLLRFDFILFYN